MEQSWAWLLFSFNKENGPSFSISLPQDLIQGTRHHNMGLIPMVYPKLKNITLQTLFIFFEEFLVLEKLTYEVCL